MNIEIMDDTIILPLPDDDILLDKERKWRLKLPETYKDFIKKYNGCSVHKNRFICNQVSYTIVRFLCILKNATDNNFGWSDISVVESQIGERLTDNEDLIGIEVLPIAELFAEDYLCLDYRRNEQSPSLCVWSNQESIEFAPVTYFVAASFNDFLNMLF